MENIQELFDRWDKEIKGDRIKHVPINPSCELCENPDYKGVYDLYYGYHSCPKCGAVLLTLDDYLDENE